MTQQDKPRILVVDDMQDNLDLLEEVLENEPYEVLTASDANLALQLAKTEKPDIALLDVRMPDVDGYELCRMLRQQPSLKGLPVLFLTAERTSADDAVHGLDLGASDYITKPVEAAELRARVRTVLRVRSEHEAAQSTLRERTAELKGEVHNLEEANRALENSSAMKDQLIECIAAGVTGKRILVADNDAETVRLLSHRLKAERYELLLAVDAVQGFRYYLDRKPDLIVANARLPGGGASAIHRQAHSRNDFTTPIIYLANTADPEQQEEARSLGAAAFHVKPLDMDAFLVELRRALQNL